MGCQSSIQLSQTSIVVVEQELDANMRARNIDSKTKFKKTDSAGQGVSESFHSSQSHHGLFGHKPGKLAASRILVSDINLMQTQVSPCFVSYLMYFKSRCIGCKFGE